MDIVELISYISCYIAVSCAVFSIIKLIKIHRRLKKIDQNLAKVTETRVFVDEAIGVVTKMIAESKKNKEENK